MRGFERYTKKRKNWYFGMKANVDSKAKIIAVATTAITSDVANLPQRTFPLDRAFALGELR
jgi:hypothetical protein